MYLHAQTKRWPSRNFGDILNVRDYINRMINERNLFDTVKKKSFN
jgi:hypothetical protein